MLSSIGRAAVRRLSSKPVATSSVASRLATRTAAEQNSLSWLASSFAKSCSVKSFATKAETTSTAKTTTRKKATTADAKPKKAAAKPKAKPKPKPKKKKAVKKKVVAKKPAPRPKKELTQEQKDKLQLQQLKKKSLYTEEPKNQVPGQAWPLFCSDHLKGTHFENGEQTTIVASRLSDLASQYKALSSSEAEQLKKRADENKLQNAAIHKAWIERHTVDDIREANNARHYLKRKFSYPKTTKYVKLIKDDRQPRKTLTPWPYYVKARWASGDFSNMTAVEASRAISVEWKKLSDAEKEPYVELAKGDQKRYHREVEALHH